VDNVWEYSAFLLPNPWRLIIDVHGSIKAPGKAPMSIPAAREPELDKLASVNREPASVAGKRQGKHAAPPRKPRIVIDAGHGGRDSGTLGTGGIEEKDVVLDVALRTGALLEKFGAEVVYTRSDDTFVPLETRTDLANKAQADLFLSIHGNSSPASSARGVETYYLNSSARGDAVNIAARENALSNYSVQQLSEMVHKITLKEKIEQSRQFAVDVDQGLFAGLKQGNPGLRDRGAKRAPFVVLIGAQMPSVLAEISFLTNPQDARKLEQSAYRQRIAASLAAGVEQYLKGLKPAPAAPDTTKRAKPKSNPNEQVARADGQRGGK
jgi:N-acetylmuramoyl-L-alanine amidase